MAASAVSSCIAADLDAKVSGKLVPRATSVIPETACLIPQTHPSRLAICSTTAVRIPINIRDTTNAGYPDPLNLKGP